MSRRQQRVLWPRRQALGVGLALAASTPLAAIAGLVPTPRQTSGPFYPEKLPLDSDSDLATVAGRPTSASGQIAHVFGKVQDESGRALSGLRVEIWQCDAFGHYHHPRDRGGQADPNFQGYGQTATDAAGAYRFRTIKPVAYPGRTPHIHFAISGQGIERLTTQMYLAGESLNARDGILNRVRDPSARARLLVELSPAPELEAAALAGRFDIVLDERFVRS